MMLLNSDTSEMYKNINKVNYRMTMISRTLSVPVQVKVQSKK